MTAGRTLLVVLALTLGVTTSARPAAQGKSCRGSTDGILCVPLPSGWYGSVGSGVADRRPAAWLLVGNFGFPSDAAKHEGRPSVPPHRVLISIGDFPILGRWAHWREAQRLRLPEGSATKREVLWHVRFARRAIFLDVQFGSRQDGRTRRSVNARLDSVRRIPK
jgi:hypothetical protein